MVISTQPRVCKAWAPCGKRENTQDYYLVRPCSTDYQDYWGTIKDPDGNVRDRNTEEERLQYIADVRDEIEYVNGLGVNSVLDVGAGLGWMLDELRVPFRAAVEIAPQAVIELASKGLAAYQDIGHVASASYEAIVAHHVIEHIPDPIGWINHVRRVLVNGGHLVLATPDFGSPCAARFGDRYRMLHDPTHCSLFTLESMHRFLRDMGFTVEAVRFPFPQRYATAETMQRWRENKGVSPPWPGNWMTFYCTR